MITLLGLISFLSFLLFNDAGKVMLGALLIFISESFLVMVLIGMLLGVF